ncbi:MAG: hypothetical protein QM742_18610 [Aquabacterium sp.]
MRTLQQTEIKTVSGAGILTSVVTTGVRATAALGKGMVEAGTIVARPLISTTSQVIRIII